MPACHVIDTIREVATAWFAKVCTFLSGTPGPVIKALCFTKKQAILLCGVPPDMYNITDEEREETNLRKRQIGLEPFELEALRRNQKNKLNVGSQMPNP